MTAAKRHQTDVKYNSKKNQTFSRLGSSGTGMARLHVMPAGRWGALW